MLEPLPTDAGGRAPEREPAKAIRLLAVPTLALL